MNKNNISNIIVIISMINWICAILFTFFKGISISYFASLYFVLASIPASIISIITAIKLLFNNQYVTYRKRLNISLALNIIYLIVFGWIILFMFSQTA